MARMTRILFVLALVTLQSKLHPYCLSKKHEFYRNKKSAKKQQYNPYNTNKTHDKQKQYKNIYKTKTK